MARRKQDKSVYALPVIRPDTAGVDIGATQIHVAVAPDRETEPVRIFGTFTQDLNAIADWLRSTGVKSVAMESTGVYWIPLFQHLESCGFEVVLVNAHHVKNVPGRKTDVADAAWIQFLHSVGLLRGSFRPAGDICAIRALVRHRQNLVEWSSQSILWIHKALTQMNVQLHNVIDDITGATGMRILNAIVRGERDRGVLASLCDKGIRAPLDVIGKSLEGDYRSEFLFVLQQTLEQYEDLQKRIGACEREAARLIDELPAKVDLKEKPLPAAHARQAKSQSGECGADLRETVSCFGRGSDRRAVHKYGDGRHLFVRSRARFKRFENASKFASWLALVPNNRVSGGKRLSSRTRKVNSRMATALRIAAQSAARSQTAIGDFYRRMKSRHGPQKAITSVAHRLARIIYHMVKTGEVYNESVFARAHDKLRRNLETRLRANAKRRGFELIALQEPA